MKFKQARISQEAKERTPKGSLRHRNPDEAYLGDVCAPELTMEATLLCGLPDGPRVSS